MTIDTAADCPVCYGEICFTCSRCKHVVCKACIFLTEKTSRSCPLCRLPLIYQSGDVVEDVLRSAFEDLHFLLSGSERFDRTPLLLYEIPARNRTIGRYIEEIVSEHERKSGGLESVIQLAVLYSEALFADKLSMWFPDRSLKDKQYAYSAYKYLKNNIASALKDCLAADNTNGTTAELREKIARYLKLESDLRRRVQRVVDFYLEIQEKYNNRTITNKDEYTETVMFTELKPLYPYNTGILTGEGGKKGNRRRHSKRIRRRYYSRRRHNHKAPQSFF